MTSKQEIPSESKQQVVEELKNKKQDIILTSSVSGIAESYLYEYKKQIDMNKIVTLTEVHEVHSQKEVLNETDLSFYIESSLALNLCKQLLQKGNQDALLLSMKTQLHQNCEHFKYSMERICSDYHNGMYLNLVLNKFLEKYEWEWLIANFDKPIANAEKIQKCMYQYMDRPTRAIVSAHDKNLAQNNSYGKFRVMNLTYQKSYQHLKEEAMMILYHLYPILWRHHDMIEKVLNRFELEQSYLTGEYSYEAFMTGLRKFYEAYHCIESSGCFISENEFLLVIQDYIIDSKNMEQKKKSKLYI